MNKLLTLGNEVMNTLEEELAIAKAAALRAITAVETIEQQIKEQSKESKKRWRAKKGEKYYATNIYGGISKHYEISDSFDNHRYLFGNYFKTEEAAVAYRDRQYATQRVLDALREYEGDWVADWDDTEQCKYYPYVTYDNDVLLDWNSTYAYTLKELYSSKEAWLKVIEEREDDVRLMMGVE